MKGTSGISIVVLLSSLFDAYAFAPSCNKFTSQQIGGPGNANRSQTKFRASSNDDIDSNKKSILSKFRRNPNSPSRRRRLKKKATTIAASFAIYSTILLRTPQPALADHPLQNVPSGKVSLRPGMTVEQMDMEVEKRTDMTIDQRIASDYEKKNIFDIREQTTEN